MSTERELKAQWESVVGSMIVYMAAKHGVAMDKKNNDDRAAVSDCLSEAIDDFVTNRGAELRWPEVKNDIKYDVYLAKKEALGGTSTYDLIRPDLLPSHFSHEEAYLDHKDRIEAGREICTTSKRCSTCKLTKLTSKFKRGAVCNSCRAKQYRERKKNES